MRPQPQATNSVLRCVLVLLEGCCRQGGLFEVGLVFNGDEVANAVTEKVARGYYSREGDRRSSL